VQAQGVVMSEGTANRVSAQEACWETWDRDRLLALVDKLPNSLRIGVSHHGDRLYSVYRVWETRSVHLTFEDRSDQPHAVFVTRIYDRERGKKTIEWLAGGLRTWIDTLEIDRDDLLAVLL
jgi:hypothetical protein